MSCEVWIEVLFFFFVYGGPVIPASFIEKTISFELQLYICQKLSFQFYVDLFLDFILYIDLCVFLSGNITLFITTAL